MLKIAVLALLVASTTCVDVLEVSGNRLSRTSPVNVVSGVSALNGYRVPIGGVSSVVSGVSPLVSTYGTYGNYGFGGISGLNTNLNYLRDLRSRVLGSAINIAPSPLSQTLAIRQPAQAFLHQPAAYAVSQPGFAVAQPVAQVAVAQPAVAQVAVAQPAIAVARPQVLAAQQNIHPVNAAITQVARTVEYRPIPYQDQPIVPQEVIVEPTDQPINIHFRSRSSTVRISSEHIPGEPGEVVQTNSQDEPSRVQHEVVKPVVQEVREIIQPYRQVQQEIQPVVENVNTVVSQGEGVRAQYVAEPVRQQVLAVRPTVQQLAVPAYQQIRVQQPYVQALGVQQVVPQVQTLSVAQPFVSQYIQPSYSFGGLRSVGIAQPYSIGGLRSFGVAQPYSFGGLSSVVSQPLSIGSVRSIGVAQPVVGVNRVVAVQPDAVVRQETVRQVQPAIEVRHAESD